MPTLPDSSQWQWLVEWGRTSEGSLAAWDISEFDTATFDGAGEIAWTDHTGFALSVGTRSGKDAFLKRYRTSTARIELDNTNGRYALPGAGFRVGDFVRLSARVTPPEALGPTDDPIPDLTTWDGVTGRQWTSHGNLRLHDEGKVATVYRVFYGRVTSNKLRIRSANDVLNVRCSGLFSDWAIIDKDAVAPEGAGETTTQRMNRIFDAAGFDFTTVTEYGTPAETMQATTLAQPMLQTAQLTMDSEGGDFFEIPDGTFGIGYQDWLTTAQHATVLQYEFGGTSGIGMLNAVPSSDIQLVVNDATFAVTGGTGQQIVNGASIARFGLRTTRRLDLIAVGDTAALTLATRAVARLKDVRPRINQIVIDADDFQAAEMMGAIKFGDLVLINLRSVNMWGVGFLAHVIGIAQSTTAVTWQVTLSLDDAFVDNDGTGGGFNWEAFSTGFDLGGKP